MSARESLFADLDSLGALAMIAEQGECSISMVGGCVGSLHAAHVAKDGEFVKVQEVGCAKHFAQEYLAFHGATSE